ncbi:MAG TPA: metallophosphoesterase [Chitinophagaceae bacterium]|nr:metallophosphoesterase [Chitinophagaceae bacterium]
MRNSGFRWIIVAIMLLLDFYVFQAIKLVSQDAPPKIRLAIYALYWGVSIVAILLLALLPYISYESWPRSVRTYLFATIVGLFFAKIIAVVFFMLDDVRRAIQWASSKLFFQNTEGESMSYEKISRSVFLSWLGLAAGGGLFTALLYGFSNKYKYDLRSIKLSFENLPPAFKGLKIVHLSDIHSGSFTNKKNVEKGIDMVMKQQPDLVLFTGDLVNDKAAEMEDYMEIFSKIKAPLGVFSTLGNHDYGDYISWKSREEKLANLEQLKKVHQELGWRLLMNEHVVLERFAQQISLVGIENWSAKSSFPKYGRMAEAYFGAEKYPFKILMSHDPSHWEAEVLPNYPEVDLMLAGHTHGMQFGVEVPGFKWSPVQYVYRQWAGLYEKGNQKLYVNRGFGFIGYPGRVGILPEITLIELV